MQYQITENRETNWVNCQSEHHFHGKIATRNFECPGSSEIKISGLRIIPLLDLRKSPLNYISVSELEIVGYENNREFTCNNVCENKLGATLSGSCSVDEPCPIGKKNFFSLHLDNSLTNTSLVSFSLGECCGSIDTDGVPNRGCSKIWCGHAKAGKEISFDVIASS